MALEQVRVRGLAPERLEPLIGAERAETFVSIAAKARVLLDGQTVLNVNSTATGGGVAELLQTLLAYARGAGVDARWVVIKGDPRFFEITKRIHNNLYGTPGDGGPLGAAECRDYEDTTARNADELAAMVRPGDVVVLHDPQTAGLVPTVRARGARVVWRCHVGLDVPNQYSEQAWAFLRPYVDGVDAYVFSCARFAPEWVPQDRLAVIAPSIDPFSAKNEPIGPADVLRTLRRVGLLASDGEEPHTQFTRRDGTRGRVHRAVDLVGTAPPPPADVPIVLQASRWDALKDMAGVMTGFAEHLPDLGDAHLILAGPETIGVADDPEAAVVLAECCALWGRLPVRARERIHLACVPMADADEGAAIVNALQRHATVVVQKSFAEGFGLTVAEAMWKSRPVIGSAVGGIIDQIISGETGWLLDDPGDLEEYARAVGGLLADRVEAERMGENGYRRACTFFLADRHLEQWAEVIARAAGT
jgi:trehalose synthase